MKILTKAFASYADTDQDGGFCEPEFALIDLSSAEVLKQLHKIHDLTRMVAQAQPTFGSKPKDGWFNYLVYEVVSAFTEFFNDCGLISVGPYLESADAGEDGDTTPLLQGGDDYCMVVLFVKTRLGLVLRNFPLPFPT